MTRPHRALARIAAVTIAFWLAACGADGSPDAETRADTGPNDTTVADSGAADSGDPDTSVAADAADSEAQDTDVASQDSGGPAVPAALRLEVEDGIASGMLPRVWGGVMDSAGDSVCWPSVTLEGSTTATLRYSNGESAGDRVDITFSDVAVGSFAIETCTEGGAWLGDCGDITIEVAASGTETLCLTGAGSGWIAALDALTLGSAQGCVARCTGLACGSDGCGGSCGTCEVGESCSLGRCGGPTCSDGVANQGELGVDCGGPCEACPSLACMGGTSGFVPAGYDCIWSDEFGGDLGDGQARRYVDQASWTFQNLDVNGEQQNYTNRECADPAHGGNWNYCVEDGALTVRARNDGIDCSDGPDADNQPDHADCALDWDQGRGGAAFTSGRLMSKHKVAHRYGYIEFRARLPHYNRTPQSGLWPAIWLLGNSIAEGPPPGATGWPACGEIDIMEWRSPDNHMGWNAIWMGADENLDACSSYPEGGSAVCGPCAGGSCRGVAQNGDRWQWDGWHGFPHTVFHTYGFLWTEDVMEVFIDGDKVSTLHLGPAEAEFQQPMYLIVNLAIGGSLGGAVQVTDWSTATLEVDYIRWYQRD